MHALVRDCEPKQHEAAVIKDWISQSRELAYEADNVLDKFSLRIGSLRRGDGIANAPKRYACFLNEWSIRHKVGVEIRSLTTKVSTINKKFEDHGIRANILNKESSSSKQQQKWIRRTYSHIEEEDFVGLKSDAEMLVEQLVNKKQRVVSIYGMGGLGKTTVANRVYNHETVSRCFSCRAWVFVSQQWEANDILQGILIKLMPEKREAIRNWRNEELVRELRKVQQEKRCLFVLDDIWATDAWEAIKHVFILEDQGSKILVTTRNRDVALDIDPNGFHHPLRFLSDDESWELLRKKALRRRYAKGNKDIKRMEEIGRKVAEQCGGLPIAVVVLGGILATKYTVSEWEIEYQNIDSYLRKGKGNSLQQSGKVAEILALSYNDLPYQLKLCFLYLGSYPEDSEIDAETMCQLWLAEGFVPTMDDAESVMGELAVRCMVLVKPAEFPTSRRKRYLSCRLHDLMRDLCLLKAEEENFMRVIDVPDRHVNEMRASSSSSSWSNNIHRLVIQANSESAHVYLPQEKEMTKHTRMLIIDYTKPRVKLSALISLPINYKMLRVLLLTFETVVDNNFSLTHVLGKLIHLRYLGLRLDLVSQLLFLLGYRVNEPPLPFYWHLLNNLTHLQTLDLRDSALRCFPGYIGNMRELKYLYLPPRLFPYFPSRRQRLDTLSKLEILENFDDSTYEVHDLFKLDNLRVFIVSMYYAIHNLGTIADYISTSESLEYASITYKINVEGSDKFPLVKQKLLSARCVIELKSR